MKEVEVGDMEGMLEEAQGSAIDEAFDAGAEIAEKIRPILKALAKPYEQDDLGDAFWDGFFDKL